MGLIAKKPARALYLETSTISQVGGKTSNTNKDNTPLQITQYKGIAIIGSPYFPVPVKKQDK